MPEPYYTASRLSRFGNKVMKPLKRLMWGGLQAAIKRKFRMGKVWGGLGG